MHEPNREGHAVNPKFISKQPKIILKELAQKEKLKRKFF